MPRSRHERSLRLAAAVALTMLYPFAIWYGLGKFEPRVLAVLLATVAAVRLATLKGVAWRGWLAGAALLTLAVLLSNDAVPLKLYPVFVNFALLATFAWSVYSPPTVIERLARLRDPGLSPAGVRYVRRVTLVWCGFFVVNGLIALYTALYASPAVWTLYNGLVAYLLIGLLLLGEFLVRRRVMRRAHG